MIIRPENSADLDAIRVVNLAAFGQPLEADIVDAIRRDGGTTCSLVAETPAGIVGHILFTPVTWPGLDRTQSADASPFATGLAPMAVHPDWQRQRIGSALVRAGLEICAKAGVQAVVVLGHPDYYPRFGFRRASDFGLRCEFPVPDDAFMALELVEGALAGHSGLVTYLPHFSG